LLEEIVVHALQAELAIELVGTTPTLDGLPRKVEQLNPDVVVLGCNDVELASALLEQWPRLTVLAVAEEGETAWLYVLTLERTRLGALSPSALVDAIREATEPATAGARWGA
jgi:DNA-binding NarL/FixJ family response regulator